MNHYITQPRTAAFLGVLLALPFTLIFLIAVYDIDPMNVWLRSLFATDSGRMRLAGLFFILGSILLLPVAVVLNVVAVRKSVSAGNGVMAYPINVALALGLLANIVALVSSFVIDQYPCWQGVANCD